jgi:hypothetical protein
MPAPRLDALTCYFCKQWINAGTRGMLSGCGHKDFHTKCLYYMAKNIGGEYECPTCGTLGDVTKG